MPTGPVTPQDAGTDIPRTRRTISTHWLYVAVIVAVVAFTEVGLIFNKQAAGPAVLGTAFVNLIKMIIGPIIFCTIVLGIRSVNKVSQVGRVGAIALPYLVVMRDCRPLRRRQPTPSRKSQRRGTPAGSDPGH